MSHKVDQIAVQTHNLGTKNNSFVENGAGSACCAMHGTMYKKRKIVALYNTCDYDCLVSSRGCFDICCVTIGCISGRIDRINSGEWDFGDDTNSRTDVEASQWLLNKGSWTKENEKRNDQMKYLNWWMCTVKALSNRKPLRRPFWLVLLLCLPHNLQSWALRDWSEGLELTDASNELAKKNAVSMHDFDRHLW